MADNKSAVDADLPEKWNSLIKRLEDEAGKERLLAGRGSKTSVKNGVAVKKSGSNGVVKKPIIGKKRMGAF